MTDHCPVDRMGCCRFEARYNTVAPSDAAVAAIVEHEFDDDDGLIDAITAASSKTYVGESCQTCGAFIPVGNGT